MTNADMVSMAFRNLLKRKLRTFLTILGVVVGTSSIVVMISLGLAMNKTFEEQLQNIGDITIITVYKPYDSSVSSSYYGGGMMISSSGGSGGSSRKKDLKLDDNAIQLFKSLPGVLTATPIVETYLYAKSGKYVGSFQVKGMDPAAMSALGYVAEKGRVLQEGDKLEVVYGYRIPMYFYNPNSRGGWNQSDEPLVDVMKDKVQLTYDYTLIWPSGMESDESKKPTKPYNVKTAGVLEQRGYQYDSYVFMNINEVKKIKADQAKWEAAQRQEWGGGSKAPTPIDESYNIAYVKCADFKTVKKINEQIKEMGYETEIPSQQLDTMQEMAGSLQQLLGAIGAVSLFVAAIGIANTMVMSIYERTKEIGVMKVIGALLSDIGRLFLLEASIIGFMGGVLGILLSLFVSYLLNSSGVSFMGTINQYLAQSQSTVSLITPWLCGLAMIFATLVGLISGYFPARRAMKINAITAIRTE